MQSIILNITLLYKFSLIQLSGSPGSWQLAYHYVPVFSKSFNVLHYTQNISLGFLKNVPLL